MSHIPKKLVQSLSPNAREYLQNHSRLDLDSVSDWNPETVFRSETPHPPILEPPIFIDFFKSAAVTDRTPAFSERFFRSSGTTASSRSRSHFSALGLELYRFEAVLTFWAARHLWGLGDDRKIVSLVPPKERWPESSLAQMISWWGTFFELEYIDSESDKDFQKLSDQKFLEDTLVIGTAFHFVHLLDAGLEADWSQVYVLETGGTKGRSREVTRESFYQELGERFKIPAPQITTEYGMCELSAQAYELDLEKPLSQRSLSFPSWVAVSVEHAYSTFAREGRGSLRIDDPLRCDYPEGICTQDVAQLRVDAFQLLGRAQGASLKGCSLNAEFVLERKAENTKASSVVMRSLPQFEDDTFQDLQQKLFLFLQSHDYLAALEQEFQSRTLARWSSEDLCTEIPRSPQAWFQAMQRACGEEYPRDWYLILPQTHSVAAVYPLVFMALAQCHVKVKPPRSKEAQKSLRCVTDFLHREIGLEIEWLEEGFKFSGPPDPSGAVMIFGETKTVRNIKKMTKMPVQGFGSVTTLSIMHDIEDWEIGKRDIFSLRQRGCLSSRATIFLEEGEKDFIELAKSLAQDFPLELTSQEKAGLYFERRRLEESGIDFHQDEDTKVIFLRGGTHLPKLSSYLSGVPFSLPVFQYADSEMLKKDLRNLKEIHPTEDFVLAAEDYLSRELPEFQTCLVGQTQRGKWNGCHLNDPLFKIIMPS